MTEDADHITRRQAVAISDLHEAMLLEYRYVDDEATFVLTSDVPWRAPPGQRAFARVEFDGVCDLKLTPAKNRFGALLQRHFDSLEHKGAFLITRIDAGSGDHLTCSFSNLGTLSLRFDSCDISTRVGSQVEGPLYRDVATGELFNMFHPFERPPERDDR
jgi:hypothetical protein